MKTQFHSPTAPFPSANALAALIARSASLWTALRRAARLVLLQLLLTLPAVVQAQEDYTYTTNNGTITITGYTGPGGAVAIPGTITGLPVTRIGERAFSKRTTLTSVTIGNSITSIGDNAFVICGSLTNVTIDNSVTSIGSYAFAYCGSLTSVAIPNSVSFIGDFGFYGCTSLTEITVGAFNAAYSSLDGVLFNQSQTTLIQCPAHKAGSYAIPDSVKRIGNGAFVACRSLTSITIPNSVTNIGDNAFDSCTSLTGIAIPNSVTIIGRAAFVYCTGLSSVTIPNSVISIGDGAFSTCTTLTNVSIGNSVTSIGYEAFTFCTSLTGVYFRGNTPDTDSYLFYSANNATVYYLPGTTGWGPTFADRPTALWVLPYPLILTSGLSFGAQTNGFGFVISWATNVSVVVEASTGLSNPIWTPVSTNTLPGGSSYFSDPQWTNHPARFYRLVSPVP